MPGDEKGEVTHQLSRRTLDNLLDLVHQGQVEEVGAFTQQAVEEALRAHRLRHLAHELGVFDDPTHAAEVARLGDEGLEDVHAELAARG